MAVQKLNDVLASAQNYDGKKFMGTVVTNVDPANQGRIKAQVPGLFEEGELPWIGTVKASPFGYGPGYGVYGSPALGSTVEIQLQEGSANHPISYGYLANLNTTRDEEFNKPNVWGYKDPSGNKLVVDQDEQTYTFTHASGSKVTFDASGNCTLEGAGVGTVKFPNIKLDGNVQITGTLSVEQLTSLLGGFDSWGKAGGGTSTMRGNINHIDGTFRSNNVTVHLHIHPTPQGNSSSPISST